MKKIETYKETSEELKKKVEYLEVSVDNLITILQYILEIVELTRTKGPQKKTLAITLLKQIIDESQISQTEKDNCYIMINNGTISNTIDLVISASKKKTRLNKYKSVIQRILHKYRTNKRAIYLQGKYGMNNRRSRDKRRSKDKKHSKDNKPNEVKNTQ